MSTDNQNRLQGRSAITAIAVMLPAILLLMSLTSCNKANCCVNFQNIRWCEFDTPESYDSWEEFREYLVSQGYNCN